MADLEIDAIGLQCPMPIAKISAGIKELAQGQMLVVKADDPAFEEDVKAFCRVSGHNLESYEEVEEGVFVAKIRAK